MVQQLLYINILPLDPYNKVRLASRGQGYKTVYWTQALNCFDLAHYKGYQKTILTAFRHSVYLKFSTINMCKCKCKYKLEFMF